MGREQARTKAQFRAFDQPVKDWADLLVIGNGIAGMTAALETRSYLPQAHILVVTNQPYPTLYTPALKNFAIGAVQQGQLLAFPSGTTRSAHISILHGHVQDIDATEQTICLANEGGRYGYQNLLIATGSQANGLSPTIPGYDLDGVVVLHRLPHYLDLRRRLGEVKEAVIIGGGVHAVETVMALLHYQITVHWLLRSTTFLPRVLDAYASHMVLDYVRQQSGVVLHLGTEIEGIVGKVGSVAGVVTRGGQKIPCQLVVACTGTPPAHHLASRCHPPLKTERGILVNDRLATSVPHVWAAGDVAALRSTGKTTYTPRAQWYDALMQGKVVATVLAGERVSAASALGVASLTSNLSTSTTGGLSILSVGNPLDDSAGNALIDTSAERYCRLLVRNERLVGYLSVASLQPDAPSIKRLIDEQHPIRDIQNALLAGTFDVNRYFAGRERRVAEHFLRHVELATEEAELRAAGVVQTDAITSMPGILNGNRHKSGQEGL